MVSSLQFYISITRITDDSDDHSHEDKITKLFLLLFLKVDLEFPFSTSFYATFPLYVCFSSILILLLLKV